MPKYDDKVCPHCGQKALVPIVYGQPKWEIFKDQEAGKSMFGGCMLKQNSKRWGCKECGARGSNEELSL
ncbi:MAG TPA: hypothetical protein VN426_16390 [Syntrophomonadaceae bacterium]|nr:hypothetical protein [Syntrophomonadaceae bacterium]